MMRLHSCKMEGRAWVSGKVSMGCVDGGACCGEWHRHPCVRERVSGRLCVMGGREKGVKVPEERVGRVRCVEEAGVGLATTVCGCST